MCTKTFIKRTLLLFFIMGVANACKKTAESQIPETSYNNSRSHAIKQSLDLTTPIALLTDANFQQGFNVLHPSTGALQGTLQYPGASVSPKWNLAQWYSTSSIYGVTGLALTSGAYQFADTNKAITIGPATTSDSQLIFAINGQQEFSNTYRTASQPFPHLLADQRIADPDGWLGATTPFLGSLDSLVFHIEPLLQYHARNQQTGYNASIHALQFSCTFLVQNLRAGNSGYGKAMYFLVMLYDDRYNLPGLSINEDVFSGQLIYDAGLSPFTNSGLVQGQWKTIHGNLLPLIKQGLDEAWSRGYLLESQHYSDYKVSLFTMGFECTGLNIGTMQIKNLGLTAF